MFKTLEMVKDPNTFFFQIPETDQQKVELTVMDNSQCELCAGDTRAQAYMWGTLLLLMWPLLTREGAW